ncbi:hypothetical protein BS47DRAFT_1386879 [Hydnum rufescens UP504]|uniref:Dynamin-type G domain-containing protein n=1 Tax=Hydnum rufescens UP504 TaxID=1448309 RepID=A0A9P6E047_9AGAM|nr:hypothetical protein BS47DRAFT_1386879 [Hydnum rufescens UP504]
MSFDSPSVRFVSMTSTVQSESDGENDYSHSNAGDVNPYAIPLGNTAAMRQRRRHFNLGNRLQSIGISADIELPQICVIGSQSTGKSSLIESISGVSLPRASGTCTRCPTECKLMMSEGPWQCEVALRFLFGNDGERLPHVIHMPFGDIITDPSRVEERLRRAQIAILNPSIGRPDFPSSFLAQPIADYGRTISFSRNYISMDIRGPGVADLSFVDLPGIIASVVGDGNRNDIEEVKQLANQYCDNRSAIILLAVTCETDYENQGATEIQRSHDPHGKRTIGVLTKPDRIEKTNEARWLKFLENKSEPLENGWFCVKLPGPADLENRISLAEAREQEARFFTQEPWASLRHHCSVPNLMERLGELLSNSIRDRIPQIKADIARVREETRRDLSRLPPPVSNALSEALRMIADFQRVVEKEVEGTTSKHGLIQKIRAHEQQFRKDLRGTAPLFVPFNAADDFARLPIIDFLAEEERDLGHHAFTQLIYLDEVQERARDAVSRQFPNHVPFEVQREYIGQSIQLWDTPAQKLFAAIRATLEAHFDPIIDAHFLKFPRLANAVRGVLHNRRADCSGRAAKQIDWLLQVETLATYTLNWHYMEDYRSKFQNFYKLIRQRKSGYTDFIHRVLYPDSTSRPRTIDDGIRIVQAGISAVADTDAERLARLRATAIAMGLPAGLWSNQNLVKLLPDDEGDAAVKIMADVRAYWQGKLPTTLAKHS